MSKTRIIIIQMKEIIYTAIFIGLAILLILLLIIMFRSGENKAEEDSSNANTASSVSQAQSEARYVPGVYTTQFTLGSHNLNLEMTVDASHINSVRIVNLDESIATMYPLMQPAIDEIAKQLQNGATLDSVVLSSERQYTQELLLEAVKTTLDKASAD